MSNNETEATALANLFEQIRACRVCEAQLPFAPKPIIRGKSTATLLIIGQAPGSRVHASGIPWDDASGRRLRHWLGLSDAQFYDESQVAIMPMGLCYPGKGKSGDLPPQKECAPLWHSAVKALLPHVQLTLLIGQYAQQYYLGKEHATLTARVKDAARYLPEVCPLPHPSPRNQLWLRRHPWFEEQVVPTLRERLAQLGFAVLSRDH